MAGWLGVLLERDSGIFAGLVGDGSEVGFGIEVNLETPLCGFCGAEYCRPLPNDVVLTGGSGSPAGLIFWNGPAKLLAKKRLSADPLSCRLLSDPACRLGIVDKMQSSSRGAATLALETSELVMNLGRGGFAGGIVLKRASSTTEVETVIWETFESPGLISLEVGSGFLIGEGFRIDSETWNVSALSGTGVLLREETESGIGDVDRS